MPKMPLPHSCFSFHTKDRILHLLPLHHLHGIVNKCLCVLWAGGTVEFPSEHDEEGGKKRPRSAVEILRRLACRERERLTLFMAVPTIYAMLMEGVLCVYINGCLYT